MCFLEFELDCEYVLNYKHLAKLNCCIKWFNYSSFKLHWLSQIVFNNLEIKARYNKVGKFCFVFFNVSGEMAAFEKGKWNWVYARRKFSACQKRGFLLCLNRSGEQFYTIQRELFMYRNFFGKLWPWLTEFPNCLCVQVIGGEILWLLGVSYRLIEQYCRLFLKRFDILF